MTTNWGGTVASVPQLVCTAASWSVVTVTAKGSQGLWSQKRMWLKKKMTSVPIFNQKNITFALQINVFYRLIMGKTAYREKQVWSVILCTCHPKKNKVFVPRLNTRDISPASLFLCLFLFCQQKEPLLPRWYFVWRWVMLLNGQRPCAVSIKQ